MNRMFSLLVVIVFCMQIGVGNGPTTLAAEQPKLTDIETDRVIVKMKPTAKEGGLKKYSNSEKTIEVPDETSLDGFIKKLKKDKNIEKVL